MFVNINKANLQFMVLYPAKGGTHLYRRNRIEVYKDELFIFGFVYVYLYIVFVAL